MSHPHPELGPPPLLPAVDAIMSRGQGAMMAKAALQLRGLLPNRTLRLPLIEANDREVAQLRTELVTAALLESPE